jgi:hypothetical protein
VQRGRRRPRVGRMPTSKRSSLAGNERSPSRQTWVPNGARTSSALGKRLPKCSHALSGPSPLVTELPRSTPDAGRDQLQAWIVESRIRAAQPIRRGGQHRRSPRSATTAHETASAVVEALVAAAGQLPAVHRLPPATTLGATDLPLGSSATNRIRPLCLNGGLRSVRANPAGRKLEPCNAAGTCGIAPEGDRLVCRGLLLRPIAWGIRRVSRRSASRWLARWRCWGRL